MPEKKRRIVLVEGNDDRATLEALTDAGLLPGAIVEAVGGADELPKLALGHAIVETSPVVLRDLDEATEAEMQERFLRAMRQVKQLDCELSYEAGQVHVKRGSSSATIFLVAAGSPAASIAGFELRTHALDDHLLQLLVAAPAVLESLTDTERVPHALAVLKLHEIHHLLHGQGVEVRSSKRLLHLFRGIVGFRSSPAKFAERVIGKAAERAPADLRSTYGELCSRIGPLLHV